MALTIAAVTLPATVKPIVVSNKDRRLFVVTLDNSYATGGYSLAPSDVGLKTIEEITFHGVFRNGANAVFAHYIYTTSKLMIFWGNAGTASVTPEVTNATDLSSYACRITAWGQ